MHFPNNWVRYCSFWEAVLAGGEKMYWVRALHHWFSHSSVTSSRLHQSSGGWNLLRHAWNPLKSQRESPQLRRKAPWCSISLVQPIKAVCISVPCFQLQSQQRTLCPSWLSNTSTSLCQSCASHLCCPSLFFPFPQCCGADCALCPLSPFTMGYLASCSQHLPSAPQGISQGTQYYTEACACPVPVGSQQVSPLPFSFLNKVSVSVSSLSAARLGGQLESKTSFPAQRGGEAALLPHCHYFPPQVAHKLL